MNSGVTVSFEIKHGFRLVSSVPWLVEAGKSKQYVRQVGRINLFMFEGKKQASVKEQLLYKVAIGLSMERSFMQAVALTTGRAIVVLLELIAVQLERHCLPSLRLAEMIQFMID